MIGASMSFSSCISKITIHGKPGTEIYTPKYKKIATINKNGEVKIPKTVLGYDNIHNYLFLISKDVGSSIYIPFGMDYSRGCYLNVHNKQQTNSDMLFAHPVFSEPEKMEHSELLSLPISNEDEEVTRMQKTDNTVNIPFKPGTYNVLQVVTHFNGESMKTEPKGTITIKNNMFYINIPGNEKLTNKKITITKELKKKINFGMPERVYSLYGTDDGQEIGIYFDDSFSQIGILEQKILLTVNKTILFEIAWM